MGRPEEYESAQRTDVRIAFARAFAEIKLAQYWLRETDPKNSLLGIVQLVDDPFPTQRGVDFNGLGEWSREQMARNPESPKPQEVTAYYGLGLYVDALEAENIRIRQSKR